MTIAKRKKWLVTLATAVLLLIVPFAKQIYYGFMYGVYILDAKLNKPEGTCKGVPFAIEKAGNKISCDITIFKDASYKLQLSFMAPINNREERKRVSNIVAPEIVDSNGQRSKSGAPLKLYILIESDAGEKIKESTVLSPLCNSWGADSIFMDLEHVKLTGGKYRVTVESMKNAPDFKTISSRFHIGLYNPK